MTRGADFDGAGDWRDQCPNCGTTVPLKEATTAAELSGYRCQLCDHLLLILRSAASPFRIFDTTRLSQDAQRIALGLQRGSSLSEVIDSLEIVELIMELDARL